MARTSAPNAGAEPTIITLKITLHGVRPPVWRRLRVRATMTLEGLHHAIQTVMGWEDCHLHAFAIGGAQYGNRRSLDDVVAESRATLAGLVRSGIVRFSYTYDFGDSWEHLIAFEKHGPPVEGEVYPVCIAGKRHCPPEDCGGPWGYEQLLAVAADPAHPDHAEQVEWLGADFDPEAFDLDAVNTALAARFAKGRRAA